MTFKEWWKKNNKDFSPNAIKGEMKWFAEKAWNQAVNEMIKQDEKSCCDVCRTEIGVFHNYCQTCGRDLKEE